MAQRIVIRRDTTNRWEEHDPVLAEGELGLDVTEKSIKIGNGSSPWTHLDWLIQGDEITVEELENKTGMLENLDIEENYNLVQAINYLANTISAIDDDLNTFSSDVNESLESLDEHDNEHHSLEFATINYVDDKSGEAQSFKGFFYSLDELKDEHPDSEGIEGWSAVVHEERPLQDWDKENNFVEINDSNWSYNETDNEIDFEPDAEVNDNDKIVVEYVVDNFENVDYEKIRNRNYNYDSVNEELIISHLVNAEDGKTYRLLYSDLEGKIMVIYSEDHGRWIEFSN